MICNRFVIALAGRICYDSLEGGMRMLRCRTLISVLASILILLSVPFALLVMTIDEHFQDNEPTVFEDGSTVIPTGGPTFEHRLFDGYYFENGDEVFADTMWYDSDNTLSENQIVQLSEKGYFVRHAFDKNGFIAYYRLLGESPMSGKSPPENYLYYANISSSKQYVTAEDAVLFDCHAGKEILFGSINELIAYCEAHDIHLGVWYYGGTPEEQAASCGAYSLWTTPQGYSVVKYGQKEIIMGDIDRYTVFGHYLAFHLQIADEYLDRGFVNPLFEYSTDTVLSRKYDGMVSGFSNVYVNTYVLIDAETETYRTFNHNGKKEIQNFAKEQGLQTKWQKIKREFM